MLAISVGAAVGSILLQNVLLLSINDIMDAKRSIDVESVVDPATQAIDNPSIATLALRPDEALQPVSASKLGEIYLMLRPLKPRDVYVDTQDVSLQSYRPPQPQPATPPATRITPPTPTPAPTPAPIPEPPSETKPEPKPETVEEPKAEPVEETETPSEPEIKKFEIIYGDAPPTSDAAP